MNLDFLSDCLPDCLPAPGAYDPAVGLRLASGFLISARREVVESPVGDPEVLKELAAQISHLQQQIAAMAEASKKPFMN